MQFREHQHMTFDDDHHADRHGGVRRQRVDADLPEKGRNHDLSNLLLAARLRLDALRATLDPGDGAAHLDAIEACLEKATEILRESDAE